jgi:hypothetical protein
MAITTPMLLYTTAKSGIKANQPAGIAGCKAPPLWPMILREMAMADTGSHCSMSRRISSATARQSAKAPSSDNGSMLGP